ncbi:MAG: flavodoxin family protein [Candidatus Thorarchaeota archaeon]
MKVLVTYRSVTGNTKKIAEAIFDEIETEKEIKNFRDVETLDGYDYVFVGYPVEGWGPGGASKKWLKEYVKGKKVCLFCTHGSPENVPTLTPWLDAMKAAATDAGAEIVNFFNCQGEMSQRVVDMLLKSDNPNERAFGEFGREATLGQPDESRIEKAREYARETMKNL